MGGSATSSAGIYDKPPYLGGKDLEVISDIQHMFDDMITSKVLSNDRYTSLLCGLIRKLQERGPIKIATMCYGIESQRSYVVACVAYGTSKTYDNFNWHTRCLNVLDAISEIAGADTNHSIGVLSCCGHAGCIDCWRSVVANEGRCIVPVRVSTSHIASTDRLGVNNNMRSGRFGRKLSSVVQKVQDILSNGNDDRIIVFCQFGDLKALVAAALQASNISSCEGYYCTTNQYINNLPKRYPGQG